MPTNHRKRRLPVTHRGQRVPNLYMRPKPARDTREGDTFEVIYRDETGKQRQTTLNARSVQRAIKGALIHYTEVGPKKFNPERTVMDETAQWAKEERAARGKHLTDEHREQLFAPPPLLQRLVAASLLGRKSGRGLYSYDRD